MSKIGEDKKRFVGRYSEDETPYKVFCIQCGRLCYTKEYYNYLMSKPDDPWCCPACGEIAEWVGE